MHQGALCFYFFSQFLRHVPDLNEQDLGDSIGGGACTKHFKASRVDENENLGAKDMSAAITNDRGPLDFLSLFIDDNFWKNLTDMTNLRATQVKRDKPNYYLFKSFQDVTVKEMKGFVGMRLYMEYTCIKKKQAIQTTGVIKAKTFLDLCLAFAQS